MKEIIGENMGNVFIALGINPKETFKGSIGYWPDFKVWEIQNEDYETLCDVTDEQFERWSEEDAWWRYAEGSNMGIADTEFEVNGHTIIGWRNQYRIYDLLHDWDNLPQPDRAEYDDFNEYCNTWLPRKYKDILEYFCEEFGASTERNVCALAKDLATYNNITMAELFRKYGD